MVALVVCIAAVSVAHVADAAPVVITRSPDPPLLEQPVTRVASVIVWLVGTSVRPGLDRKVPFISWQCCEAPASAGGAATRPAEADKTVNKSSNRTPRIADPPGSRHCPFRGSLPPGAAAHAYGLLAGPRDRLTQP